MMRFLLSRLEENPISLFDETELRALGESQFDALVTQDLLVPAIRWKRSLIRSGRLLSVRAFGEGRYEAFDEYDLDFDPIDVDDADLASWEFDIARFATELAIENELSPEVSPLSDRLWHLGMCASRTAALLAFLPDRDEALDILREVPSLLPRAIARFVVVMPTFAPPASWAKQLEGLGISPARIGLPSLKIVPAIRITSSRITEDDVSALRHEPSGLTLSRDLRKARLRGQEWALTFTQGRAIQVLLAALIAGDSDLHQDLILEVAESKTSDLKTLFHRSSVIGTLVVTAGKPGVFRLNV